RAAGAGRRREVEGGRRRPDAGQEPGQGSGQGGRRDHRGRGGQPVPAPADEVAFQDLPRGVLGGGRRVGVRGDAGGPAAGAGVAAGRRPVVQEDGTGGYV